MNLQINSQIPTTLLSSDQKFQLVISANFLAALWLDIMVSDIHSIFYLLNINISAYGKTHLIYPTQPWLMWLSGLSAGLRSKGWLVRFPVRACAWVAGQVPSKECARGNHTIMFLSLFFSPPSHLKIKKVNYFLITNSFVFGIKNKYMFIVENLEIVGV